MNKNKGFIGIGLILAIVLGIAIVGGGAYYLGKSGSNQIINNPVNYLPNNQNQNQNLPQVNQNQNIPVVENTQSDCISNSIPSITVLSPNGGEVYKTGDKITVKWKSCNVLASSYDIIVALHQNGEWQNVSYLTNGTTNDGSEIFTIPANILVGSYKIRVGSAVSKVQQDYSDNSFTINSAPKTISTTLPQYVGAQNWPPVITTSSQSYSCNNIGIAPNTEGNDITAQRVINGKTYCIHSLSDGYAGGRGYTYTYTTSNGNGTKIATFGLTYQSCGVWQGDGTSKYSDCQTEQSTFKANLDNIIDSLM